LSDSRESSDIVSIDRIKESLERFGDRFLDRVFNQEERDTLNGRE